MTRRSIRHTRAAWLLAAVLFLASGAEAGTTVAIVKGKLARAARKVVKHWKSGSLVMTFTSGLRADRARYPHRTVRGFTVRVPPRSGEILFHVPYNVIYEENGQAACEEMERWIHKKLGEDIETVKKPARTPD